MAQTDIETIEKLPIKKLTLDKQKPFICLADRMISLNKQLYNFGDKKTSESARLEDEIKIVDDQIDEFVYDLYRLTKEEKDIVRGI